MLAVQVAGDPSLRVRAAAEFELRTLANTTKPTYDTQLKAVIKIAEAAQFPLLPMGGPTSPQKPLPGARSRPLGPRNEVPEPSRTIPGSANIRQTNKK